MRIAFFDTHAFEREFFAQELEGYDFEVSFLEPRLSDQTVALAGGHSVVCCFVNDHLDAAVIRSLREYGVKLIALRSVGFNNVDLLEAERLEIPVVRVPDYSPYSVAEHAVCLLLALNRKIHKSHARVRELNFSLNGLIGFDLHGKTVGIIGSGRIGTVFARIMNGFGCHILVSDPYPNSEVQGLKNASYTSLDEIYKRSDVISLHVPLTSETRYMINDQAVAKMKPGVYIINTGRGALIDTRALIGGLKSGHIGAAGLDVYEEEEGVFFEDLSEQVLKDDVLARLMTFQNVLITSHQGFLTREALSGIAKTTLENIKAFEEGLPLHNQVLSAAN